MRIKAGHYKIELVSKASEQKNYSEAFNTVKKIKVKEINQLYTKILRGARKQSSETSIYRVTHRPTGIDHEFTLGPGENFRTKLQSAIKDDLIAKIKAKRKDSKEIKQVEVIDFGSKKLYTQGGVFIFEGNFTNLPSDLNDPSKFKKPISNKINYLGIEMEFNSKGDRSREQNAMKRDFREMGLGRYINVGTDHCGHELRILVPDHNFKPILKKLTDYLKKEGYSADSQCGMHVHIDMRNRDVKLAYKNLYKMQEVFFAMIPKARRTNDYCKRNVFTDFDSQLSGQGNKYYTINAAAYREHKTLEVRLHHGTIDYKLIVNWLKLLVKTVNQKEDIEMQSFDNLEKLQKTLKLRDYEVNTIQKRIASFA